MDNPVSLYADTKKSYELMAHCYSKLYNIPSTGLQFFTVYDPAGRPEIAYFGLTNKLIKDQTIQISIYGNSNESHEYSQSDGRVEFGVDKVSFPLRKRNSPMVAGIPIRLSDEIAA